MDQRTVRKLERDLEKAIVEVVVTRNKNWKYPLLPSRHTIEMIAKAAAAVYEAADENYERASEDGP